MKGFAWLLLWIPLAVAAMVFAQQQAEIWDKLPPAPAGGFWKLVWHDEFDGNALDLSKWTYRPDAMRRNGWWNQKTISVDGFGHLIIRTIRERGKYLDGCVTTQGKFERAFGYYVARIQLQRQPGHWPAFWITGIGALKAGSKGGRLGAEIDIMEKPWLENRVQHTLHWNWYGLRGSSEGKVVQISETLDGFHTFGLLWQPDKYVFYVDGKETWRTASGVSLVPEFILLSDEIGEWAGEISQADLPDQFAVDYVRVYDLMNKNFSYALHPAHWGFPWRESVHQQKTRRNGLACQGRTAQGRGFIGTDWAGDLCNGRHNLL